MARKIARQSEVTPLKTIDEYLWNERLGVTQLPPVNTSQGQPNTSSLPPQSSQAPTIDYDSANGENDMFGSGVSSEGQAIAPKAPMEVPKSTPAVSKAAAVSTLYGDVNPTPTTGESSNGNSDDKPQPDPQEPEEPVAPEAEDVAADVAKVLPALARKRLADNGSQANRNNSSENLPNGPDSFSPESPGAAGEEEGGAALASELGEASSLAAFASKRFIHSVLDPINDNLKEAKFKYIRHNKKTGKWEIWQKGTGKTLSTHDSKAEAESAFRGMERSMHGGS
jgi:hypothetical protein